MENVLFYTAQDVSRMFGVSRSKAYHIVKELNAELAAKGYIVIAGKVPKKFLADKYYGLAQ